LNTFATCPFLTWNVLNALKKTNNSTTI